MRECAKKCYLEKVSCVQHDCRMHIDYEEDLKYFDEVLTEARLAVLLNEQNDPYSR